MKGFGKVLNNVHCVISVLVGVVSLRWICQASFPPGVEGYKLRVPEFADPLKNISVPGGSNIELFCNVKHLGVNRIMWLRKEEDKQVLLAINTLVITNNPRVAVSLIPSSGDVSQSILYIYTAEQEDNGVYHCIVNSNPIISQTGIVEVKHAVPGLAHQPKLLVDYETSDVTTEANRKEHVKMPTVSCDESECGSKSNNFTISQVFCIDVSDIWTHTRDGAQFILTWIYTYFGSIL